MATESPLIHDGSHFALSTSYDARRSSITGTTLTGPNGSAQFCPVYMSTATDLTCNISTGTAFAPSTFQVFLGVLQNTPKGGEICDIGLFGVTKALAGSSSIVRGYLLQASSTNGLCFSSYAGGNGSPLGVALEGATAVGNIFTMFLFGGRGYST